MRGITLLRRGVHLTVSMHVLECPKASEVRPWISPALGAFAPSGRASHAQDSSPNTSLHQANAGVGVVNGVLICRTQGGKILVPWFSARLRRRGLLVDVD